MLIPTAVPKAAISVVTPNASSGNECGTRPHNAAPQSISPLMLARSTTHAKLTMMRPLRILMPFSNTRTAVPPLL